MRLKHPVIDLHTHLRNDIPRHTKIAKDSGIDAVVYMANCEPPMDCLERVQESLTQERNCIALPVSAITLGLKGRELVDVDKIRNNVVGFSDDGRYLKSLDLFEQILKKDVLVLAHCCPSYETGVEHPCLEAEFLWRYLSVLEKTKGRLHVQHLNQKESINLIRNAKKKGLNITCETCPHYFTFTQYDMDTKVNPPLRTEEDIAAVKEGLRDGTIDVIASDYAPRPRETGISGFRSFIPLSYGLVLEGIITEEQLKEKIYTNPKKIIESSGYKLDL